MYALTTGETVASTEAHLHLLLRGITVDHMLCVAPEQQSQKQDLYLSSCMWAHTAHDLAAMTCPVSVISWDGEQAATQAASPATGPPMAQTVFKARCMEDRPSCGAGIRISSSNRLPTSKEMKWMMTNGSDTSFAWYRGHAFIERLVQAAAAPRMRPMKLHPGMSCVVTGGTKGLGLRFAHQLVNSGCKYLVLTSRSGQLEESDRQAITAHGKI